MNTLTRRAAPAVIAGTTVLAALVAVAPAEARGGADVVRSGSCSAHSTWKLKAGHEDGRIEVEAEVDTPRVGRTWAWRLLHDGREVVRGHRTTTAPSGSFTVRRVVVNHAGTDTIVFRASNPRTGELCRGSVRL